MPPSAELHRTAQRALAVSDLGTGVAVRFEVEQGRGTLPLFEWK